MTSSAKNYAGQNLRGHSFKGQNLSGADFSGANLRGTDFSNAILIGANFTKAKTGVEKRWLVFQIIIAFMMSALSGLLAAFSGTWIMIFFQPVVVKQYTIAPAIAMAGAVLMLFVVIFRQGATSIALGTIALLSALAIYLAILVALVLTSTMGIALVGAVGVAVAGAVAMAFASIVAGAVAVAFAGIFAGIVALSFVVAVAGTLIFSFARVGDFAGSVALVVGVTTILFSIYIAWRTLKDDPKFDVLLRFSIALASFGGTSFRGADLTEAIFAEASLKSSDFRHSRQKKTKLTRTVWRQAQKLNQARLGDSILAHPEVRELLVTGKPNPSNCYAGLNLRGANLDEIYLDHVDFKRAILSEASFRQANLQWANLTEAQAIGTDFTGAELTGVCLEGWSYDHTTKLDDVDCRFVFELEQPNTQGSRERRPHDPDKEFEKGDFQKLYSISLNVVELLIRNGMNRKAFVTAWQELTAQYPDLKSEDIQEIKKKGQDIQLTVTLPEDTDKGKFEQTFDHTYATQLQEIEASYQAQLLQEKDRTIETMKDMYFALAEAKKGDVTVITQTEAKSESQSASNSESKSMAEQNPITIKAGRDISGNVINLGQIKGNVTNAINQIPATGDDDRPDLKTLLTQLQEAISADPELADEDKADALEHIEDLAKIALHDQPAEKASLAAKALRALKRIIKSVPNMTNIVETIGQFFGA